MNNTSLTKGRITPTLIRFAGPYLLALLLQTLYGAVDLIIVGQFASTADVSGVAIGSQVMTLITYTIVGITTAITVLLGQYYGAQDRRNMARTLGSSIILFTIIGIIITLIFLLGRGAIVNLMQTPTEAVTKASDYLLYCGLGTIFIVGYNVVRGVLMGVGDSRTPLLCVALACVINIILDLILVKGYGLGASGAAIATTTAQAASLIFSLLYIKWKGLGFSFNHRDIRPHKKQTVAILRIGLPLAVQNSIVVFSFLIITALTNQMGLVVSASVGIVEKAMEFLGIPTMGFYSAVAAMVAQNVGAGAHNRARQCMYVGCIINLLLGLVVFLYCRFAGQTITGLFTTETAVVVTAASYLSSYSLDCFLLGALFCINAYFIGYGNSTFPLVQNLVTTFGVRIPLVYYLTIIVPSSLYHIGYAAPIATIVALIISIIYLKLFKPTANWT